MKPRHLVMAAACLAILAAGCRPRFDAEGSVTATDVSPFVVLDWTPAIPMDTPIAQYRIDVDGVEVSRVDPDVYTCVLKGLQANTHYTISVTAYDEADQWSGDASSDGTLTVEHTATETGPSGSGIYCEQSTPTSSTTTTIPGD